jgi:hypothetical protein
MSKDNFFVRLRESAAGPHPRPPPGYRWRGSGVWSSMRRGLAGHFPPSPGTPGEGRGGGSSRRRPRAVVVLRALAAGHAEAIR